jgi:hypothetical protein
MNNIQSAEQLRLEIVKLEQKIKITEQVITNDIKQIKESLKPSNLFLNAVSNITGIKFDKENIAKDGIAFIFSILIQRFILKSEKKLEHKLMDVTESLMSKIKMFIERMSSIIHADKK